MSTDLPGLIQSIGYVGVWGIVFAEVWAANRVFSCRGIACCLRLVFWRPQHLLNVWLLVVGAAVCAIAGDSVGYFTGHRFWATTLPP